MREINDKNYFYGLYDEIKKCANKKWFKAIECFVENKYTINQKIHISDFENELFEIILELHNDMEKTLKENDDITERNKEDLITMMDDFPNEGDY